MLNRFANVIFSICLAAGCCCLGFSFYHSVVGKDYHLILGSIVIGLGLIIFGCIFAYVIRGEVFFQTILSLIKRYISAETKVGITLVFLVAAMSIASQYVDRSAQPEVSKINVEEKLNRDLTEATSLLKLVLPKKIDSVTSLTDVEVQGATVYLEYSVYGLPKDFENAKISEEIITKIRKEACSGEMKAMIQKGAYLAFRYINSSSPQKAILASTTISKCS